MSQPDATEPAWWFAFRGSELLVFQDDAGLRVPAGPRWPVGGLTPLSRHQIGHVHGGAAHAIELAGEAAAPPGMAFVGLRAVLGGGDPVLARAAGRAAEILEWERTNRYCGACGSPTVQKDGEWAKVCPACRAEFYPRVTPAVIVLVRDGDRALLARSHRFPPGRYSTIAGYVDPGETLEEAVAREVQEEVGVQVRQVRYFGSQPWPFPHSLMVGFTADYAGGELRIQEAELADARWFHGSSLPDLPPPFTIARRLIEWFAATCAPAAGDAEGRPDGARG